MAQLRDGRPLRVLGESVPFSFWPLRRGVRRWGLNSMLYAADPWAVVDGALERCRKTELRAAQSFVRQAHEYFRAGTQSSEEASPLLYYYSFMNLGKALALANRQSGLIGRVTHGLGATFANPLHASSIDAFPSSTGSVSVFDELTQSLSRNRLAGKTTFPLAVLMAQSLFGHRLWVKAANWRRERFVAVDGVELLQAEAAKHLWINLAIRDQSRRRKNYGVQEIISKGELGPAWDAVTPTVSYDGIPMRVYQQSMPTAYSHRPSDKLMTAIDAVKPRLWRSIFSSAPYRKYYLYLSPIGERRLHQFLSVYALMFFLGSAVRYQPALYLDALQGPYGPFIREFLASQPSQFVFGLASEFAQREVSRAAVV